MTLTSWQIRRAQVSSSLKWNNAIQDALVLFQKKEKVLKQTLKAQIMMEHFNVQLEIHLKTSNALEAISDNYSPTMVSICVSECFCKLFRSKQSVLDKYWNCSWRDLQKLGESENSFCSLCVKRRCFEIRFKGEFKEVVICIASEMRRVLTRILPQLAFLSHMFCC